MSLGSSAVHISQNATRREDGKGREEARRVKGAGHTREISSSTEKTEMQKKRHQLDENVEDILIDRVSCGDGENGKGGAEGRAGQEAGLWRETQSTFQNTRAHTVNTAHTYTPHTPAAARTRLPLHIPTSNHPHTQSKTPSQSPPFSSSSSPSSSCSTSSSYATDMVVSSSMQAASSKFGTIQSSQFNSSPIAFANSAEPKEARKSKSRLEKETGESGRKSAHERTRGQDSKRNAVHLSQKQEWSKPTQADVEMAALLQLSIKERNKVSFGDRDSGKGGMEGGARGGDDRNVKLKERILAAAHAMKSRYM